MAEEKKPEGEKAAKKKTTGAVAMAEEAKPEAEKAPRKKLTKAEKQALHTVRLKRMGVACFAGILAGILSFVVDRTPPTGTVLGILLLLAAIVFQKYVFLALRMDYLGLTAKDWAFQGFMTFSLWFITWTILLSTPVPGA